MAQAENEGYFEAYWPRAERKGRRKPLAKRLATLDNAVIAEMWTYGFRGDQLFEALREGIQKRFKNVKFVSWKEIGNIHSPTEHEVVEKLPQTLREYGVTAAITGMAA